MGAKSTNSVAGTRFTLARLAREANLKGDTMFSTTTRGVANHKIDQLLRDLVPFENYNKSIVATKTRWDYRVTHWGTEIVRIKLVEGERQRYDSVDFFNPAYYSQTTSTLQGRILRNLLTRNEVENILDWYVNNDIPTFLRLSKMARVK
jgi:hypothetical protein